MLKNQAGLIDVLLLLRASGNDGTGLTPTARISQDGAAWKAAINAPVEDEDGVYSLVLDAAETNCDHLAVKFTEATALTVLVNLYPIDVALYKADVSGLMPTSHINATAGKVDGVALVDTTTVNTDMRGTDNALQKDVEYRRTVTGSGDTLDETISETP